jgi:hypothetical protein
MNGAGVDLNKITTVDVSHQAWREAPSIQNEIPEIALMDLSRVVTITKDFQLISPDIKEEKIFMFYDIHDHTAPFSQMLIDRWVPKFTNALIAIHDMSIVSDSYTLPVSDVKRSIAKYRGVTYSGFAECAVIVEWAIKNNVTLAPFHSGVSFEIKNGLLV